MEGNLSRTGHGVTRAVVVVIIAAACTATLLVGVGAAQDDLVQIDGRVLWIAGQTMVVASYVAGDEPIRVDLSRARQEEYMRLTTGDAVTVTGSIAEEGAGVMATSIRSGS